MILRGLPLDSWAECRRGDPGGGERAIQLHFLLEHVYFAVAG